jgi:hypothetical protein
MVSSLLENNNLVSQMACWNTHPIIREIMGSIPNLTTTKEAIRES